MAKVHGIIELAGIAILVGMARSADDPALRGRDPFVFRLALDDRPRMCVAALRSDLFLAYDPLTCGLTRAFGGGVEFRGKVFDFSQQTSASRPPFYFADVATPCVVRADTPGLTLDRVTPGDAFTFDAAGAMLELPPIDTTRFDLLMLTFEERSRKGPLRVEVLDDSGTVAQWFDSTLHGSDDAAFQSNTKRLHVQGKAVRIRFRQARAEYAKVVRGIRVHGAPRVWAVCAGESSRELVPSYRGHSVTDAGKGRFTLHYVLPTSVDSQVDVEESPEAILVEQVRVGIERRFRVKGLPAGETLVLRLGGDTKRQTFRVTGAGRISGSEGQETLEITADGELVLEQWWDR